MKRRKFFKLASTGVAGVTFAASCTNGSPNNSSAGQEAAQTGTEPTYRKSVTSTFAPGTPKSANDRVVVALIGAGGHGTVLILQAVNLGENVFVKYICDVDDTRGGYGIKEVEKVQGTAPLSVRDMRTVFDDPEVDAVFIATPEHWHALATIWACQAGKDVYVEKSISHNIGEGQKMIEAAMKYEREHPRTDEQFIKDQIRDHGYDIVLSLHKGDLASAIRHDRTDDIPYMQKLVDIVERLKP
jgi:hypothetical protein